MIVSKTGQGLADTANQADMLPPIPTRPDDGPDLAAWNEGERMSIEEATAYARETARVLTTTAS